MNKKRRQDGLIDQLRDLIPIAEREGMYDAADFMKKTVELGPASTRRDSVSICPSRNGDYYAIPLDSVDEDYDGKGQYGIVHRRYWHLNHCLDDRGLPGPVDVPDEIEASTVEFNDDDQARLRGFTVTPWSNGFSTHVKCVGGGYRTFKLDDIDVKRLFDGAFVGHYETYDSIVSAVDSWAGPRNLVVVENDCSGHTIISKTFLDSLPEFS